MRDGRLEASGHNWVEGQGAGPRIDKKDGEEDVQYDAMGNKIENKKAKKLSAGEARKVCTSHSLFSIDCNISCSFFNTSSSRRSVWHGKREARRSPMTNSEIVEYISRFFSLLSFWFLPVSMHILHLLFVLCSSMYSHRNSSLCIS